MKKIFLLIGLCILFTGFVSLNSQAQEAEMPENFLVIEEFVSPSNLAAFSEAQSEAVNQWKKHEWDVRFYCYKNDDNAFYWVAPIENFASIDVIYEKMAELGKKMKDDGYDGSVAFRDLSTVRQSVIRWSEELSYHPSGEFGQTKDNGYVEWAFFYLKSGHEKEAAAATKKYIDFYNSIPEINEWDAYNVVFGHDTPCMIFMTRSESELALRKLEEDLNSKYKKDFQKLWSEFVPHVRKVENKKGWFWPGWSMNLQE